MKFLANAIVSKDRFFISFSQGENVSSELICQENPRYPFPTTVFLTTVYFWTPHLWSWKQVVTCRGKTERERGSEGRVQKGFRLTHEGLLVASSSCPHSPGPLPLVPAPGLCLTSPASVPLLESLLTLIFHSWPQPAPSLTQLIMDLSIAHFISSFFNHIFHLANRKTRLK